MAGTEQLSDLAQRLRCPVCGSREAFAVELWQTVLVYADGIVSEGDEGQQWDGASPCRCDACDHEGVVADFDRGQAA
jgi:hypothetical protein